MNKIKLLCCDIDGTLTDGTVYYSEKGEELKQFSHRDGRGFYLVRKNTQCKIALITSEKDKINRARAERFLYLRTVEDYIEDTVNKIDSIISLSLKYNIDTSEIAFIGDDTNDLEAMIGIAFKACPADAHKEITRICNYISINNGGHGAVRDIIDYMLENNMFYMGK